MGEIINMRKMLPVAVVYKIKNMCTKNSLKSSGTPNKDIGILLAFSKSFPITANIEGKLITTTKNRFVVQILWRNKFVVQSLWRLKKR